MSVSFITPFSRQCVRASRVIGTALTLLFALPALADLPTVERPQSGTGTGFWGNLTGYIQDGLVLGGLVLAAAALLMVGTAALTTFNEVRGGKAEWGKFIAIVVVGIALIVLIIYLADQAANILV